MALLEDCPRIVGADANLELAFLSFITRTVKFFPGLWKLAKRHYTNHMPELLDDRSSQDIRRILSAHQVQRIAQSYLWRRYRRIGKQRVSRLVECRISPGFDRSVVQGNPRILLTWHAGNIPALFSALGKLGLDPMLIKLEVAWAPLTRDLNVRLLSKSLAVNGIHLKSALDQLRRGGTVMVFLDGIRGDSTAPVQFFGRTVNVRRGTAVLSRLSGATLFPCIARWSPSDGRYIFVIDDGIRCPATPDSSALDQDTEILQKAVSWFESYLQRHPEDLRPGTARLLRQPL